MKQTSLDPKALWNRARELTPADNPRNRIALAAGFLGIAAISFDASQFGPAPMAIGLGLLVLFLPALHWPALKPARRDPLVVLVAILAIWTLVRTGAGLIAPNHPDIPFTLEGPWHHFRASGALSLLIGIWLAAYRSLAPMAVAVMVGAMILHPALNLSPEMLSESLAGARRLSLGNSPNALGLFATVMALTGIVLTAAGIQLLGEPKRRLLAGLLLAAGTYLLFSNLAFLLATKSRSPWIATAVLAPATVAYTVWALHGRLPIRVVGASLAVLGAVGLALIALNWDLIADRFADDARTITALLTLSPERIEYNSLGERWLMWSLALDRIAERPLWGWGPGYVAGTLEAIDSTHLARGVPGQYHNTYIHFAVSMGLVWTALWVALQGVMVWRGVRLLARKRRVQVLPAVGLAFLLPFLVVILSTYRFNNTDGTGLYLFGTGLLIGLLLPTDRSGSTKGSPSGP